MKTIHLTLHSQELRVDEKGYNQWFAMEESADWPIEETALLLCDVWNQHWSRSATERLDALAPHMNEVVKAARSKGMPVVFAAADITGFYRGTPARQKMIDAPPIEVPIRPLPHLPTPPLSSLYGESETENRYHVCWYRLHPALEVDLERDAITEDATEIYCYLHQLGIKNILFMGIHVNCCVLARSFGILNLQQMGFKIAFVGDLTDAMYTPASPPYVTHERGTQMAVEYIEKFVCPTIQSSEVILG